MLRELMFGTDTNWILLSRQLPAQSQLDNVEATFSKHFFQSYMTTLDM